MSETLARKKFTEFKERTAAIEDAELDDYWASLPLATIDECSASGRAASSSPATR
jgi:hypothetical protein